MAHLEGHLGGKDELVLLEESSGGVEEHAVRDGVYEGIHAQPHLVVGLRALDGLLEHHSERLAGEQARGKVLFVFREFSSRKISRNAI